ncbi:Eukaryotic/viral aspartic protease, partial [Phytophthora megakarya]
CSIVNSQHDTGTELQRWKQKLKTAFRGKEVDAGRQPVAQSTGERVNPANIPLPRAPKKTTRAVFGSAEQSPYFHDSHMVSPSGSNGIDSEYSTWHWKKLFKTSMEEMDPAPRFEIAQRRPLGKIITFRGRLEESEHSMQWLRGFVYEMKDTHTSQRALSRKMKRTWSLLSDKFTSYYCSQFSQSANTRYYRVKGRRRGTFATI